MRKDPFWVEDHPRPEGLDSALPTEADVTVIGSGLTGLSAGIRLAEAGRSVAIIDSNDIASGASSMNGGMLSPDVKAGMRYVHRKHGPEIAREVWAASVRSVEIVLEHVARYELDARIVKGGMTALGLRPKDLTAFQAMVAWYRDHHGVEWEVLGPDRVHDFVGGSERFLSGVHKPEGVGVHPAGLVFGLAQATSRAGALLVPRCAARSIERRGEGFIVSTSQGEVKSGEVIVATNGYTTNRPVPALATRVVSVGSYIIVTEPLPTAEAKAFFPTNSMSYTKKRLLNYMRRTPDDRILIGGRRNLHPGLDLDESARDLRRRMIEFWPSLADKQVTHAWSGRLGVPFDLIPHAGQVEGVWFAMGYGGHGVGLSTLLGHDLAGMILGEDPPSVFSMIPNRGRIYYRGRPWFLTPASLLYRTLDRLGR